MLQSSRTFVTLFVFVMMYSSHALGGVHVSLTGYDALTHARRQITENSSLGGSLAVDIYSYLRIGLSYSAREETTSGKKEYEDANGAITYPEFRNTSKITQYSLDLTVVLYNGSIPSPYIFGGMAKKGYEYRIYNEYDNLGEEAVFKLPPKQWVWNAGIGTQVLLSSRLSLKVSYSFSEGIKTDQDGNDTTALDKYLQYGVSYRI